MQTSRANRTPFGVRRQAHQRKKSLQSCCSAAGHTDEARKPKIVGLGSVGLDYLAQVAAFPKPDEKLRTKQMETRGGGNCANALTAAARLGLEPHLVSKVGADSIGEEIEQELLSDGVQTNFLLKATDHPSPFTYIIVDKQGGTRTCIHTPGASYAPEDLDQDTIDRILSNAQLAYFDGRLTESAVVLARAARKRGIPVLVEAERLRPTLEVLLQEADYVCTSAHFPQQWTGEASLGDALHTTLQRLPNVKWMVTTLGKKGSVLLERCPDQAGQTEAVVNELLSTMLEEVHSSSSSNNGNGSSYPLGCTSKNKTHIRAGEVTSSEKAVKLLLQRGPEDSPAATAAAAQAASAEASANADPSNAASYGTQNGESTVVDGALVAKMTVASAASLPQEAIEDTTGAGDAFIGTVLYAVTQGMPRDKMLKLAAVVAACKCTALGARPGLPYAQDISPELLNA
ncbi:hypothetical protein WJX79_010723 [Trebouxia sp. C0005]